MRRTGTIYPYTKARPAPAILGTVTPEGRWITEHGEQGPVDRPPQGVELWAPAELVTTRLWRSEHRGELHQWEGHPIRWRPAQGAGGWRKQDGDVRLVTMGRPVPADGFLAGLIAWRDWLTAEGASSGSSIGSASMSLLKATLQGPLWCRCGPDVPPVGFTFGGRSELGSRGRGTFGPAVNVDMQAAYARTLADACYGGKWFHWPRPRDWRRQAADGRIVFAHARVEVPAGLAFGPLPQLTGRRRPENPLAQLCTPYPVGRRLQGTWVADELQAALDHGCRLRELLGVWVHVPVDVERPFTAWWRAVERGRRLPDQVGATLAKQTGNALWGQFCINVRGSRSIRSWRRQGKGWRAATETVPGKGMRWPLAPELAEAVCGRVRAELFGMMLGRSMVCVHTDGGWFDSRLRLPHGWRVKAETSTLRCLGPQRLAYLDADEWCYSVSGVLPEDAADVFEQAWSEYERGIGYVGDRAA